MTAKVTRYREITAEDEIDLRNLLQLFWRRRLLIFLTALGCASAALVLALVIPKRYTASTLLIPVEANSHALGGAGSLLSQFSGLANLVGISTSGNERSQEYLALLESTLITEKFIRKYHLLPILYRSRWNNGKNRWHAGARVPTLWEAGEFFKKKIRNVQRNSETGLITLYISWKKPDLAANWANSLVELTNEYARRRAVDRAKREIAFLNEQAAKTTYVEQREVVFSIMQGELTREMMAKGTNQYALRVIDPAFAPEKPSFPKPILWTLLGLLSGIVFGCGYVLIRYPVSDSKPGADEEVNSAHPPLDSNGSTSLPGASSPSSAVIADSR